MERTDHIEALHALHVRQGPAGGPYTTQDGPLRGRGRRPQALGENVLRHLVYFVVGHSDEAILAQPVQETEGRAISVGHSSHAERHPRATAGGEDDRLALLLGLEERVPVELRP